VSSLVVKDAAAIVVYGEPGPLRGPGLASVEVRRGGSVRCDDGTISAIGAVEADAEVVIDAAGLTVVPGFVDPHTHLPFFGWRADEDAARLTGVRYEDIHSGRGGIYRSAALLAAASDDDVLAFSQALAARMLASGTTTFETKSGYGLSVEAELRQLRLARALAERVPQRVVATCLAAHALPEGETGGSWVARAADELLPAAVQAGLARAVDLYVESIAFALEHAARLAHAAEELSLHARVHADQLADNQTASFAARWGFRSADHLNHCSPGGVDDLAASDTAAVLLPAATFTLRQQKMPPARDLIEAGAIVALGSDLNPGTAPVASMPFVIALACRLYGLRPLEALVAGTTNAAYVLGLEAVTGRLAPGYAADIVLLELDSPDHVAYRPDMNPVAMVIAGGEVVHATQDARTRIDARR
jgi:imidazolonepropionase